MRGSSADDALSRQILGIVRRRAKSSFFVVDDDGRILLADPSAQPLPTPVQDAVRNLARGGAALEESIAVTAPPDRYVVRLVELTGVMGHRRGVFVERFRQRSVEAPRA